MPHQIAYLSSDSTALSTLLIALAVLLDDII
jgi:hypothetical protein